MTTHTSAGASAAADVTETGHTHIRIIVADDHPLVRDGLVAVLSTQADFAVVGEAGGGE